MQLQVILKPPPENVQELYLESLGAIGIDLRQHDIKFEEDNWESPTLGRLGHRLAGHARRPRDHAVHLLPAVRRRRSRSDLSRADVRTGAHRGISAGRGFAFTTSCGRVDPENARITTYGEMRLADELQFSVYNFEFADVEKAWKHFESVRGASARRCWKKYAGDSPKRRTMAVGSDKTALSAARRLRSLPEVLAPVQHSRCARRDLGDRARGRDCADPSAGGGSRQGLCRSAAGRVAGDRSHAENVDGGNNELGEASLASRAVEGSHSRQNRRFSGSFDSEVRSQASELLRSG